MSRKPSPLLPALGLLLVAPFSAPDPAGAVVIAQNDGMDWQQFAGTGTGANICPCFCPLECFGTTLTAPADFTINYLYMAYGAAFGVNLDTAVDFMILQNPSNFDPGSPFVDGTGNESVGLYLPLQFGGGQLIEVNVVQSQVTPPQVEAGEEFTVAFCYNHYKQGTPIAPNTGFGPIDDSASPGASGQAGPNWIYGLQGFPEDFEDVCFRSNPSYAWQSYPGSGDFAIRATDVQVDWLNPPGDDDDDDAADDDDAVDDDDAADDDDAVGGPVILGIVPGEAVEGVSVPVAITGEGFTAGAQAFIGGLALSDLEVVSDSRIDGRSPQALATSTTGYDVTVNTNQGSNTLPGAFLVRPAENADEVEGGCTCAASLAAGRGAALPGLLGLLGLLGLRRRRT